MRRTLWILLLLGSCRYSPSEATYEPRLTHASGIVKSSTSLPYDWSGTEVVIEGTHFSTITDSSGYWMIEGIPEGMYSIFFTRDGYDTVYLPSAVILAPTGLQRFVYWLNPTRHAPIRLDSNGKSNPGYLYISHLTGIRPYEVVLFFGRDSSVGPSADTHVASNVGYQSQWRGLWRMSMQLDELMPRNVAPGKRGFAAGDTVWVVAYQGNFKRDEFEPRGRSYINLRNRSNVLKFTMPW